MKELATVPLTFEWDNRVLGVCKVTPKLAKRIKKEGTPLGLIFTPLVIENDPFLCQASLLRVRVHDTSNTQSQTPQR